MPLYKNPNGPGLLAGPNGHPTSDVNCCECDPPPPLPGDCCTCEDLPPLINAVFHGVGCTGWGLPNNTAFEFMYQGQDPASDLCFPPSGDPHYWTYETACGDIFHLCCEGISTSDPDGTKYIGVWLWWCNSVNAHPGEIVCNSNTGTITGQIGFEGSPISGGADCCCISAEPFWITFDDVCPPDEGTMNLIRSKQMNKGVFSPETSARTNIVTSVNTRKRKPTLGSWFKGIILKVGGPHKCGCDYRQIDAMPMSWWLKEDTTEWLTDRLSKEAERLKIKVTPRTLHRLASLLVRRAIKLGSPVGS